MSWTCQCPREMPDAIPVCVSCMYERPHLERQQHVSVPMYRLFEARIRPQSSLDDVCSELGCSKTLRQHIEEFRAVTQR
jgi:hypothetical protein